VICKAWFDVEGNLERVTGGIEGTLEREKENEK
jgi:hypothetical protein